MIESLANIFPAIQAFSYTFEEMISKEIKTSLTYIQD